jgi:hypothetical protein
VPGVLLLLQAIDCLEHSTSAEGAASAPLAPPDTTGHTSSSSSPQAAAAAAAAAGAAAAAASADSDPRPPMDLVCSITLQLFHDPVLLVGSGCTYERRAIEQWLAAGKTKDPETGEQYVHLALGGGVILLCAISCHCLAAKPGRLDRTAVSRLDPSQQLCHRALHDKQRVCETAELIRATLTVCLPVWPLFH